ncbi:MAG: M14 family metallopeptidase, partial [Gemmatimonadota bacterium]
MRTPISLALFLTVAASSSLQGQQALGNLAAGGSPKAPKVQIMWDRFYDHAAIGEIGRRLQAAHPNTCRLSSIGKSHENREMWLITVTNFDVGDPDTKPAMYIDGNIHSNEVQGTEFAMYTAWYLCEMRGQNAWVDSLLATRTLYIVPTINPDGREDFIHKPNNASSPRTGAVPRDSDGDGIADEDTYDDLDGDGSITQMRRRSKYGTMIQSPEEPRLMIRAPAGTQGEWEMLGSEGIDNDGDGLINEDGIGGYDPNRNWPWRWQPQYVQGGADFYPTSLPETQAVVDFVTAHPNIAGAQSFHNNGGMILRGPGSPQDEYRPQDVRVFDELGKVGERILPG